MAYFGVQAKGDEMKGPLCAAFQKIRETLKVADGPARHDLVQFTDAEGYLNLIVVAYWQDPKAHLNWSNSPEVAGWWNSDDRLQRGRRLLPRSPQPPDGAVRDDFHARLWALRRREHSFRQHEPAHLRARLLGFHARPPAGVAERHHGAIGQARGEAGYAG